MFSEKDFFAAGDLEVLYQLGLKYARGELVTENPFKAAKLMRQAAEQGHAEAQFVLGVFYYVGIGVPVRRCEAQRWFRKAAAQGNKPAQQALLTLGETW